MKHSVNIAKLLLLGGMALGLAACDGKEDFTGLGADACPIGANCRVEARGSLLVELSGPIVGGLGYKCGSSLEYIKLEETKTRNDQVIPSGMAACPTDAKDITFYIGRATDQAHHVELGKAYLPAIGRAKLHAGSDREIVRLTWADVIESPRRVEASKLDGHLALLALLDSGEGGEEYTHQPVLYDQCINDALDRYLAESETVTATDLLNEIESGGFDKWEAFLDELESIKDDNDQPICGPGEYAAPNSNSLEIEDLKSALIFAMNATRAGSVALSYQDESLLAHLISDEVDLAPNPEKLGQIGGSVLVFPDGSVRGFPTATLFEREDISEDLTLSNKGEIRRDLLQVVQSDSDTSLSGDLSLKLALKGLEIEPPKFLAENDDENNQWTHLPPESTNITITGKFLGSAIFDGVVWEPKEVKQNDIQFVFPQLPEKEHPTKDSLELGRFSGDSFLGLSNGVSDLLVNNFDEAPIRVVRESYGSTQMHTAVIGKLKDRKFSLRLMRACTDDEETGCENITDKDEENYPTTVEYEDGLEIGQGGTTPGMGQVEVEVYQNHKALLEDDLTLLLEEKNDHLYITTVFEEGSAPTTIGYISHTELYTDEGLQYPESAIFTMIFDDISLLEEEETKYLYGLEIQGRLDLRDQCSTSENRFYRLSDTSFKGKQTAAWIGNYWALKDLEDVGSATDAALKPKLIHAQGSAYLMFDNCP